MVSQQLIDQVNQRIVDKLQPYRVVLFGSCVSGLADPNSDMDLLIVTDTDQPAHRRYPLVRRLLSDMPAAFDIVVKTPAEYCEQRAVVNGIVFFAEKYGKVLYERPLP